MDLDVEKTSNPIIYLVSDDKKANHTLVLDDSQNDFQKNGLTKYIITIDLKAILENYLFAILKQYRTFEGVRNSMCSTKDVNFSIRNYITKNVVDRYKFDRIELYVRYQDLRDQNLRRYSNVWVSDESISVKEYLNSKIQTDTEFDFSSIRVLFNQEKSSQEYNFEYYFKLFWVKL